MSDNRTTELREKLTEHGIEYETNDHMGAFETRWNGFTAIQISENANLLMSVTPEQAVAATLGSGTLTAKQVREAAHGHYELRMVRDVDGLDVPQAVFDWQAIADELNARAERTCKQIITDCNDGLIPPFVAHCSECGAEWGYTPNYCPNCGAKVVGA